MWKRKPPTRWRRSSSCGKFAISCKSRRSREFITAEHYTTAKGWAEERGFIYIKVTDEEELEDAMKQFTTPETLMQPMLMEVFTDKEKDTTLLREYYHGLKNKPNE